VWLVGRLCRDEFRRLAAGADSTACCYFQRLHLHYTLTVVDLTGLAKSHTLLSQQSVKNEVKCPKKQQQHAHVHADILSETPSPTTD
jgi:hypothetical protein